MHFLSRIFQSMYQNQSKDKNFSSGRAHNTYRITLNSSVIRQKGESQNGCLKKTKHVKFFEKRTFLTPLIRTRT